MFTAYAIDIIPTAAMIKAAIYLRTALQKKYRRYNGSR